MKICILSSVMQLYNKYVNTNILKLNRRMSESSISPWPNNFMLIGQAMFHTLSLDNQKYPKNRCYTGSLENCFFLCLRGLKLTLYVHSL